MIIQPINIIGLHLVICTGEGKPAGFTRVLVTGTGPGPEILTPKKPGPVGSGHGFCHIKFKLRINSQRHVSHPSFLFVPRLILLIIAQPIK